MTTKSRDNTFKMFSIRFLSSKDYNYVLSSVKDVANEYLKNGEKINLSDALTIIIKEWEDAKKGK